MDSAGNVYVADVHNNRVVELPAGSESPVQLPFTSLNGPRGVAVDSAGNVYVADIGAPGHPPHVLKLPVG